MSARGHRRAARAIALTLAAGLGVIVANHGDGWASAPVARSSDCSASFPHPGAWEKSPLRAACDRVRVWKIRYVTHDGLERAAYVVLPLWYDTGDHPVPLVIAPHGRGVPAPATVRRWGRLPALGPFAVVVPDGQGRRLERYSWGYPGQIADLARMPGIVERALPWLRVDRRRIYAVGTSMGGQEALLLDGRYPHRLAGAVAFDAVADMALRYRDFTSLRCGVRCRREWVRPLGQAMQALARLEIGGTPETDARAYAVRSPLTYARTIAFSGVPVELWWSSADRVVTEPTRQSERLFLKLKRLNPRAPVEGFAGIWAHASETRAYLPIALADLGLLPPRFDRKPSGLRFLPSRVWP